MHTESSTMKHLSWFLFTSLFLSLSPGLAVVGSHAAIKFYKSPRSFFPSGESNTRELEKNRVKDHFEFSYLVQRDKKQFWVQASSVVRDLHLSEYVYSNDQKQIYKVQQFTGSTVFASPVGGGSA
ncbi:MAG: hypothetical protein ACXWC9_03350, partial [Pseudobdellovibrionaceae bacterium]